MASFRQRFVEAPPFPAGFAREFALGASHGTLGVRDEHEIAVLKDRFQPGGGILWRRQMIFEISR